MKVVLAPLNLIGKRVDRIDGNQNYFKIAKQLICPKSFLKIVLFNSWTRQVTPEKLHHLQLPSGKSFKLQTKIYSAKGFKMQTKINSAKSFKLETKINSAKGFKLQTQINSAKSFKPETKINSGKVLSCRQKLIQPKVLSCRRNKQWRSVAMLLSVWFTPTHTSIYSNINPSIISTLYCISDQRMYEKRNSMKHNFWNLGTILWKM